MSGLSTRRMSEAFVFQERIDESLHVGIINDGDMGQGHWRLSTGRWVAGGVESAVYTPAAQIANEGRSRVSDNPQILARPAGLEPATPGLEGEIPQKKAAHLQQFTRGAMPECHAIGLCASSSSSSFEPTTTGIKAVVREPPYDSP